jgi:hypothetical protein
VDEDGEFLAAKYPVDILPDDESSSAEVRVLLNMGFLDRLVIIL